MKSILNKIFKIITILIFIITILFSIGCLIITTKAANASIILRNGYSPLTIYDEDDEIISTDSCYYSYVSLNDISKHLINAILAAEDKGFYEHNGFSIPSIARAIITNIKSSKYAVGASTITQQYVKNVYLNSNKTIERKLNEIAYAIELEKKYTKDQILEAYLNSILFGGNVYGIAMAAKYYFSKHPSDIGISEAAYLAGLIQAPNKYNAYNYKDAANNRKNIVLKRMLDCKYINSVEYEREKAVDISKYLSNGLVDTNKSYLSSYLDYIYASTIYKDSNISDIYTYLDKDIQQDLYKIASNEYKLFQNDKVNCAIVVIDNKTYGIKALVGNRASNKMVLNYATSIPLQPGSTIKPILDYAPAIEYLSYSPATIINDELSYYSDGSIINNYDHKYKGKITLRQALRDSRNVPAVKLYNEVGGKRAFEFAEKIGIKADDIYEANAIGGATTGYTLLDLANAYTAFANLGYYKKATGIRKYLANSEFIYDNESPKLVMRPTTAWLINNILHDTLKGSKYDLSNAYLMAKTGQTNYDAATRKKYNIPEGTTKDSLIIAYTKDLTIGVWVGMNKIEYNTYMNRSDVIIPRTIIKIILDKYSENSQEYEIIPGIIQKKITIDNGVAYLANGAGFYEYFEMGTEPTIYIDTNNKI